MTNFLSTRPYKGTRDFPPAEMRIQNWMFDKVREVVGRYGYEEYGGPMLEPFELYAAKTGEEIVNNQLYWLMDRGERKLAVRPEMTPTMARMVAADLPNLPRPIRWFSIPNLWRYERPQRGRLREHWQLNVDVLDGDPALADAEILALGLDVIRAFGGEKHVEIRLNNRRLSDHFFGKVLGLAPAQALATTKLIDARDKMEPAAYDAALAETGLSAGQILRLETYLKADLAHAAKECPCPGLEEVQKLMELLAQSGFEKQVRFDPSVMRGLDYYTGTVFEMYDISPENRRAMFGGGRYDNLVGLFGKAQVSGVGFGMGDVTLRNFLETHGLLPKMDPAVDVFVTLPSLAVRPTAEKIAAKLRGWGLKVITPLSASGFGAQLKTASRHGARFSVLLGETELARGAILVKDMTAGTQSEIALDALSPSHFGR